jgi:hypothetical protein
LAGNNSGRIIDNGLIVKELHSTLTYIDFKRELEELSPYADYRGENVFEISKP